MIKYSVHKALLAYFSEYFDAACYGDFVEAKYETIDIRTEDPEDMSIFISWVYSGYVRCNPRDLMRLWILGDRLRSPLFANEVMYYLFDEHYNQGWLTSSEAEFVYSHTHETSKLRLYVRDLIIARGPLRMDVLSWNKSSYEADWHSLILRGGDLVLDIAKADPPFRMGQIVMPGMRHLSTHHITISILIRSLLDQSKTS